MIFLNTVYPLNLKLNGSKRLKLFLIKFKFSSALLKGK